MTIEKERYYRGLFWVAAAYDLVLGFVFLFFTRPAADLLGFEDELPAFDGYVSLLAAFVFVRGFWRGGPRVPRPHGRVLVVHPSLGDGRRSSAAADVIRRSGSTGPLSRR